MLNIKLFGPPGTGKTTSLVRDWIKPFLTEKDRIAVVSLTRATATAFYSAFTKLEIDFPSKNVRTIHSWAYASMQGPDDNEEKKRIPIIEVTSSLFKECIQKVFGGDIKDDEIEDMSNFLEEMQYSQKPEIALWQACTKVRTTWTVDCHFVNEHIPKFIAKEGGLFYINNPKYFYEIYLKYKKWKEQNGVYDFTDLLMMALREEINPFKKFENKGLVLIIDEVQDLYPLAFRVFEKYKNFFDTVILAGDDDQTIYSFAGARPELFLNFQGSEIVLSQSYRLSRKILEYSLQIIQRNKIRKEKQFAPRDIDGIVDTLAYEQLLDFIAEPQRDTMILARTNFIVQEYIQLLEEYDIPYRPILSKNIKVSEKVPRLVQIHETLRNGKDIPNDLKNSEYMEKFLTDVVYHYIRLRTETKRLQKEMKENIKQALISRDPYKAQKFSIPIREILSKPLEEIAVKLDKNHIRKWRRRLPKLESWLKPKIRVGTIHASKGLEAERVLVDPRVTRRIEEEMTTQKGMEAERRVWYVACTRAKEELYIIDPPIGSFYRSSTFPLPEIKS